MSDEVTVLNPKVSAANHLFVVMRDGEVIAQLTESRIRLRDEDVPSRISSIIEQYSSGE